MVEGLFCQHCFRCFQGRFFCLKRFSQEIFCNYPQPHLSYATPPQKLFRTSVTGQKFECRVPKGDETPKEVQDVIIKEAPLNNCTKCLVMFRSFSKWLDALFDDATQLGSSSSQFTSRCKLCAKRFLEKFVQIFAVAMYQTYLSRNCVCGIVED